MKNKFKKLIAMGLCISMTAAMTSFVFAEETEEATENASIKTIEDLRLPPEKPEGIYEEGTPPERPEGEAGMEMPGGMKGMGGNKGGMGKSRFTDVTEDAWYSEYVNFVSMRGIMKGKGDTFRPTETTTRGEYVLALYNAAGSPEITEECSFTDVDADSEYADAIAWAEKNNIASGEGDGAFLPDEPLTREMAMTFLFRALAALNITADTPDESVLSDFSDNLNVSDWAKDSMNTLVHMGIISGTDEGTLNPQDSLVNAEVATMIYRVLGGNSQPGEGQKPEGRDENRPEPPENLDGNRSAPNGEIPPEAPPEMPVQTDTTETSEE